jgi:hypothetical protein
LTLGKLWLKSGASSKTDHSVEAGTPWGKVRSVFRVEAKDYIDDLFCIHRRSKEPAHNGLRP